LPEFLTGWCVILPILMRADAGNASFQVTDSAQSGEIQYLQLAKGRLSAWHEVKH
jgi:hypothetical protein